MTPAQRRLRATAAAQARWARVGDRKAAVAPARRGFLARFEKQVDPDGVLSPAERARRAEAAMKSHMALMSLKASQKAERERRRKKLAA